ncbi:lytic transglycosylase domain-containing protein [Solimonas sp. SE-A11]|uniref:lytic transglycosylase domain-containing protein n=1 Tax=Solimonas sp. SE-A11 TaxID=3054954 RepID=UPI00259CC2D6|nr:lytic transglycosylase domain-containing protein [Solimonas sp. SE-A11]MDM4771827.1 lytic transglycosylase domain-containing protein [Solimonas sp. SE-A11]
MLLGLLLAAASAQAAEVYVYREPAGTRLFTDQRVRDPAYVFISKFGRPTAYVSCKGISSAGLEARLRSYEDLIVKYADQQGVEPALVKAVMRVESCFDHRAVSRVGARGLMQLMPGTAADMGVSDSFDPAQNIRGGVTYLRLMLDRFGNNQKLALAAYNAGPGAVTKHQGVPPFKETQAYVEKVRSHYERYRSS